MCPTNFSNELLVECCQNVVVSSKVAEDYQFPDYDVQVLTSSGQQIPAHSHVLAMGSVVMEKMLEKAKRNRKTGEKVVQILGVPFDAVTYFVRFLYSSRCSEEEMEKYGIHLLVLSHVFIVPKLKQKCSKALAEGLSVENVIDVLRLATLCDAPDLYLKGMKFVTTKFKAVQKTEGWRFVRKHDPWIELDIVLFIDEIDSRNKRSKRHKEEQIMYGQISEAMDCLVHICTQGCTSVGPYDMGPNKKEPCQKFSTCQRLQVLIRHFATCKKRVNSGCSGCKRMWQLLKLHASMCDHSDHCRVPLCRQFKLNIQKGKKGEEAKWRLLVKKVVLAKTVSSLSLHKSDGVTQQMRKSSMFHCDALPIQGCDQEA